MDFSKIVSETTSRLEKGNKNALRTPRMMSGILAFDYATGGGVPEGISYGIPNFSAVAGPPEYGKTTLMRIMMANLVKQGYPVMYIDAEHKEDYEHMPLVLREDLEKAASERKFIYYAVTPSDTIESLALFLDGIANDGVKKTISVFMDSYHAFRSAAQLGSDPGAGALGRHAAGWTAFVNVLNAHFNSTQRHFQFVTSLQHRSEIKASPYAPSSSYLGTSTAIAFAHAVQVGVKMMAPWNGDKAKDYDPFSDVVLRFQVVKNSNFNKKVRGGEYHVPVSFTKHGPIVNNVPMLIEIMRDFGWLVNKDGEAVDNWRGDVYTSKSVTENGEAVKLGRKKEALDLLMSEDDLRTHLISEVYKQIGGVNR